MKRRLVAFATLLLLVTSVLGAGSASALSAKLDFHVADSVIGAGIGIPQLGARAVADNGDIVSVVGAGTFNLGSGKTTGGGTFVHTTSGASWSAPAHGRRPASRTSPSAAAAATCRPTSVAECSAWTSI